MREIKSINGLRVISVDEGANIGTVSQIVVDLAEGAMLGIIIGDGGGASGVAAADIQTIGTDVIMISNSGVAHPLSELPELEKRKAATTHLVPVFTDLGRRLGVVSSIFIDPYEKVVTRYEISSGAIKDLADGLLVLPIIDGTVHGVDAVILPDKAVQEMGRETGGLFARFTQWGDSARKQYQQVAESAEKMVETGSETLKKEAAVVRERAGELTEKAKVVSDKVGEKAKAASKKALEVGEKVTEKVSEKATEAIAEAKETVAHLGAEGDEDKPCDEAEKPCCEPESMCCSAPATDTAPAAEATDEQSGDA